MDCNELPWSPHTRVLDAVNREAQFSNLYPDQYSAELARAIAEKFRVLDDQVLVGCGSLSVLHALMLMSAPGGSAYYSVPSFVEYPRLASAVRARSRTVEDNRFLDWICQVQFENRSVVIICNPGNPTGRLIGRTDIVRTIECLPTECLVIVDEAYGEFADYEDDQGCACLVNRFPNLAVLRTFSKAYGLAGLRVGFTITSLEIAAKLRSVHLSFAANSIGQAAALASLDPEVETDLERGIERIVNERETLRSALSRYWGPLPVSRTNFVYVPNLSNAGELAYQLSQRGVHVGVVGSRGLRITAGKTAWSVRLLDTLEELVG